MIVSTLHIDQIPAELSKASQHVRMNAKRLQNFGLRANHPRDLHRSEIAGLVAAHHPKNVKADKDRQFFCGSHAFIHLK